MSHWLLSVQRLALLALMTVALAHAQSGAPPACTPYVLRAGPERPDPALPILVLIHGMAGEGHRVWLPIVPALAARFTVLAPDLPGFGEASTEPGATSARGMSAMTSAKDQAEACTSKNAGISTPTQYADYVHTLVSTTGGQNIVLIGHSLGAAIALRYAADHPENLRQLVLLDAAGLLNKTVFAQHLLSAPGEVLPANLGPLNLFKAPLKALVNGALFGPETGVDKLLKELPASTRKFWLGDTAQLDTALALMAEDFTPVLRTLTVPTMVLWGADDHTAPVRSAHLLAGTLARAQLQLIENAGHNPMRDQPERVTELLLAALNKMQGETSSNNFLDADNNGENRAALAKQNEKENAVHLPAQASTQARDFYCHRQSGLLISGPYRHIVLDQCQNITLRDVSAQSLHMNRSDAQAERLILRSEQVAIECAGSRLQTTLLAVRAPKIFQLDNCLLDIAGAELNASKSFGETARASTLAFSLSTLQLNEQSWPLHRNFYRVRGALDNLLAK